MRLVLALLVAAGVVSGTGNTTDNRTRRSSRIDLFLHIVREIPGSHSQSAPAEKSYRQPRHTQWKWQQYHQPPPKQYQQPPQQYQQPPQQYQQPPQQYQQPAQQYQQPVQQDQQPPQQYQQPAQQYQLPVQQDQQPAQKYQQPAQKYEPPPQQHQSPAQQYEPPPQQHQQPAQQYQQPAKQYEPPAQQYEPPAQQYEPPAQQYEPPAQQDQQPAQKHQQPAQQHQPPAQQPQPLRIDIEIVPSPDINDATTNNLNIGTGNKAGSAKVEIVPSIHYDYKVDWPAHRTVDTVPEPQPEEEFIPFAYGQQNLFETSSQIIQSYRRQRSVAPQLPGVMPDLVLPDRIPVPTSSPSATPPTPTSAPTQPDFNRSLRLRVDLTVASSDFTEAYDIEWHAGLNTARLVIEDGSTTTYRAPLVDGGVQFLEVQVDRAGGSGRRRCTLSPRIPASPADKSFPGLPDMSQFQFSGYTSAEGRSMVERWLRVVAGGPGQDGAVEGESLTFTHEMLVVRDRGLAVPLRYTVVIDSSILGPASESYVHRYDQLPPPIVAFLPNVTQECDYFEDYHDDEANYRPLDDFQGFYSKVICRFEPIRQYAVSARDARYDTTIKMFKDQFKRKYMDSAEEAVRKTLLIKSSRFIEAGNRVGSGFKMAANFMADRLDEEIEQLYGVQAPLDGYNETGVVPFPFSEEEVKEASSTLGEEFDWRPLGAVSPVRFQETTCSSCWAFAVAGSTEGALFKKTKKLVQLSPQCLVDCAGAFGANGCNGTWPSYAYDYIQARGLPARADYTDYKAKVLECKDKSVSPVTHISGHVNVTANSEAALKVAIKKQAPTVVVVDAKAQSFIFYKSGVLKDKRCGQNKPKLNHAALAVGWGTKDGPHFIIKNTWSAKWGEGGYIRIAPDSCAVMERPSYPLIKNQNIDRADLKAAAENVKD